MEVYSKVKQCTYYTFILCIYLLHIDVKGDDSRVRCSQHDLQDTTAVFLHNDVCYQFVDNEVHWTTAMKYCRKHGGKLVSIPDSGTQQYLASILNALPWSNSGVWIGLHDRNGELDWEWVTSNELVSESPVYFHWGKGHPKAYLHNYRDCVRMKRGRHDNWKWHETPCSLLFWKYKYICEYEPSPIPTTRSFMVDLQQNGYMVRQTSESRVHGIAEEHSDVIDARDTLVAKSTQERSRATDNDSMHHVVYACIMVILCGIVVLLVILLIRRHRRSESIEDPTSQLENPLYNYIPGQLKPNNSSPKLNIYSNPFVMNETNKMLDQMNGSVEVENHINNLTDQMHNQVDDGGRPLTVALDDRIPYRNTTLPGSEDVDDEWLQSHGALASSTNSVASSHICEEIG